MIGYIYKTTCLVTGLIYIGQHAASSFDLKYIGSGKKFSKELKKYGKKNFICELVCECNTIEELNYWEKFYIKEYSAQDLSIRYNISPGGQDGWFFGCKHSEEAKIKIGEASRNRIWIKNIETNEYKNINKNELDNFDSNIWVRGSGLNSFENKSLDEMRIIGTKISEKKKGKYYFTNKETNVCKMIFKEEILDYIALGYWYGNRDFPKCGFIWLTDGVSDFKVYSRDYIGILIYKFNLTPGRSTSGITWSLPEKVFNFDNSIITKQVNKKPLEQRKTKEAISHIIIDTDGHKHHSEETKQIIREKRATQKNLNCANTKDKLCYNNGIENKLFFEGKQPEGWALGRISKDSKSCCCIYLDKKYSFSSISSAAGWWSTLDKESSTLSLVSLRRKIKQSIEFGYYTIDNKKYTDINWFWENNDGK